MKKIVCAALFCLLLLLSCQLTFAEEKYFEFDALSCTEIKISYTHGQGFPNPDWTRPDYNYTTTDINEIKLLVDAVNGIKGTPYHNFWGSNDGVYMSVYFNNKYKSDLYFDVTVGICQAGDKSYVFNKEDYIALTNVIYDLKTKNDIKLYLDNEMLKPDVSPRLLDNRTLVPVRAIGEALGAEIIWNNEDKSVELKKAEDSLTFVMGEDYMVQNGSVKKLDVGGKLINHTAMVPVRALSEFFGFVVEWENNSVYIWSK